MSTALSVLAGDTFSIALTCLRADGVTPVDLTGATVKFSVGGAFQKITPSQIVVTNAPQGLATINILPTDTSALAPGNYAYDVVVIEASGTRSTVATGILSVLDHPTKT